MTITAKPWKRVIHVMAGFARFGHDASGVLQAKTRHGLNIAVELRKLLTRLKIMTHMTHWLYLSANAHTHARTHMSQPIIRKRVIRVIRVMGWPR